MTRVVREFDPSHEVISLDQDTIDSIPIRWSIVILCEHAGNSLPTGWNWGPDEHLKNMHWGIDPGARDFVDDIFQALINANHTLNSTYTYETNSSGCLTAINARTSRLFIDCNRSKDSPNLVRFECDGVAVEFNTDLNEEKLEIRKQLVYNPFHAAIQNAVEQHHPRLVMSIHSFNPIYENNIREVQFGVLFSDDEIALGNLVWELQIFKCFFFFLTDFQNSSRLQNCSMKKVWFVNPMNHGQDWEQD